MAAVTDLKAELLTLLVTAFGVKAHYARPAKLPDTYEIVYLAGNPGYRRGGGEQYRTEQFGLSVGVEVFMPGDDPAATDVRRWEIIDAIDAALIDADFGGYGSEGGTLTEREASLIAYENGWEAHSVVDVSAEERF